MRPDQMLISEQDQMDILGGTQAERTREAGDDESQKDCVSYFSYFYSRW